jgi:short-subunit dehydrogenase
MRMWRTGALALLATMGLSACASVPGPDAKPFAGRTVVVTGASSGFGKGIAMAFGARGANVVLAARRVELLQAEAAAIRASGGQALVVQTDVSDPAQVAHLAEAAEGAFHRVDVWINDAGVISVGRFEDTPEADEARIVDVNFKGVMYGSFEAMRRFKAQGSGTLINFGSTESVVPLPYQAVYSGTKHAILGMDEAITQELDAAGVTSIHVVTIMPWAADTPIWEHSANYSGREPRAPLLDPPDKVVQAVLHAALEPRVRVAVGWKAKTALAFHRLSPGAAEGFAGHWTDKIQMHTAPAGAPNTPGDLYRPVEKGTDEAAGLTARWHAEDEETPPTPGTAPPPN